MTEERSETGEEFIDPICGMIMAAEYPERIDKLVLANVEAFDNWPSGDEKPFIRATQIPVLGRVVLWLWSFPQLAKLALSAGSAVSDKRSLTPELVGGFVGANLGDSHRRAKTQRFLAGQLDPRNNRCTIDALAGLRKFHRPTMIVWGQSDPHFGLEWGERLHGPLKFLTKWIFPGKQSI